MRTSREESGGGTSTVAERFSGILAWFILAVVFWCGLYRIQFGINYTDEGLYLASPMRYALGDLPFRDEWMNSLHMFDLVLAPLFHFFPNVSVYHIRLVWLVVQFSAMLAVYMLFKRFSSPLVVSLACGSTVWLSNFIWTPGYHLMGAFFFALGWALWLSGCLSKSRRVSILLGLVGGLAFTLAAISYVPLVIVLIVPALVLAAPLFTRRRRTTITLATFVFLVTYAALSTVLLLSFAGLHLLGHWIDACNAILAYPWYVANSGQKFFYFVDQISRYAPIPPAVAMIVLGVFLCSRWRNFPGRLGQGGGWIAMILLAAVTGGLVFVVIFYLRIRSISAFLDSACQTLPLRIVAAVSGLHLGALILLAFRGSGEESAEWRLVYSSFLAGAVMLALIYAVPSNHAFKITYGVLPIMVSGVVAVHRLLRDSATGPIQRAASTLLMAAFSLAVGIGSFQFQSRCNYQGRPMYLLTHKFSDPLLSGLRAEREQVSTTENVLRYLSGRVQRGEFLLAYDGIPLLYYLTRTRPAIDHCWTLKYVPIALRKRAVQKMIEGDRVPRYAVRYTGPALLGKYSSDEAVDPINAFVEKHYTIETALPPFQIWRLKENASHTTVGTPSANSGDP